MTTRHLVDPELVQMLDQFPAMAMTPESLPQIRMMTRAMLSQAQASEAVPQFPDITVSERFVPGPAEAPEVRVLVYLPTAVPGPLPALLWIHGGGYIIGTPEQEDLGVKSMVSAVGCAAVSV